MKEKIQNYLQKRSDLKEELKIYVVDKSIPLDERWDNFIFSGLGTQSSSIERFNCKIGENYIDTLENKYAVQDVEDIVEWAIDEEDNDENLVYNEKDIIKFKENVLKSFIKSYKFNW